MVSPSRFCRVCCSRWSKLLPIQANPGRACCARNRLFFGAFYKESQNTFCKTIGQNVNESLHPKNRRQRLHLESPDAKPRPPPAEDSPATKCLQAGLDLLDWHHRFDGDLRLVAWNHLPRTARISPSSWPASVRLSRVSSAPTPNAVNTAPATGSTGCRSGSPPPAISRHVTERQRARTARSCCCAANRYPTGDFVTLYSDVTEQRYIEHLSEQSEHSTARSVSPAHRPARKHFANLPRPGKENEAHRRCPGAAASPPAPDQRHIPS